MADTAAIWYLSQGDTGPELTGTLEREDESGEWMPQDLTDATVTLTLWKANGTVYKSAAAVTVESPTDGTVSYAWTATDSAQGGLTGKFRATWPSGLSISFPNTGPFQIRVSR